MLCLKSRGFGVIVPDVPMGKMFKGVVPFISVVPFVMADVVHVVMLIAFPGLVLVLADLL